MIMEPACYTRECKHFIGVKGDEPKQIVVCKAFPKGIPKDIAFGNNKHMTAVEGDHDIQFEKE